MIPTDGNPTPKGRYVLAVLAFALLVRSAAMALWSEKLLDDPDGYRHIAEQLTLSFDNFSTLGFGGLSYISASSAVAFRPPLYPWLLALTGSSSIELVWLAARLHILLGVLTSLWTIRLGVKLGLGPWSLLAGALVAVDPILLSQSTVIMTETLAACLAVGALDALAGMTLRPSAWRAAWCGLLLGACALCRPTFLPFAALAPLALLYLLARSPSLIPSLRRARWTMVCVVTLSLIVGGWGYRNHRVLGRTVFGTTHGGYTLLLGNNPAFFAYLRGEAPTDGPFDAKSVDPLMERAWREARSEFYDDLVARFGPRLRGVQNAPLSIEPLELRVDRHAYESALRSISADPSGFLWACAYRVRRFWGLLPYDSPGGVNALRYVIALWYAATFFFLAAGIWTLGRTRQLWQSPWLFGLLLTAVFMAVHTIYWTDMRMRAPVTPFLYLVAIAGAQSLWRRRAMSK
jgi:hypothetical protein